MPPKKIRYRFRTKKTKSLFTEVSLKEKKHKRDRPSFLQAFSPQAGTSSKNLECNLDIEPPTKQPYQEKRSNLSKRWREIESDLLDTAVQLYSPQTTTCYRCLCQTENIIRCVDCGVNAFFCYQCWDDVHKFVWFHKPDIWQSNMFIKMEVPTRTLVRNDGHVCETGHKRLLTIIDYQGYQHKVNVCFCFCEREVVTLYRHNIWACSPTTPKVGVCIHLMEWLRVLNLNQQVSTEGFCSTLLLRFENVPTKNTLVKDLSKCLLNETLESYRQHVYQLEHSLPNKFNREMDDGTSCPACKGDPSCENMFCLDGNFGLVRRKAAGTRSLHPHHLDRFFISEERVSEFMEHYSDSALPKPKIPCSEFIAGSTIRSKSKNAKLHVKGVFGACCRHEFPKVFLDMLHGERLGYAVFLLLRIAETVEKPNLKVFYDIACRLSDHLSKQKGSEISQVLNKLDFAVPVFHGYGHNMICQTAYNPRRKQGFGLTEGETVERLWSFLRKFSRITKEMKPEHRTDLLTDALIHYGIKIKAKLGTSLTQKLKKAENTLEQSKKELNAMLLSHQGNLSVDDVKKLVENPLVQEELRLNLTHQEQYALKLHELEQHKFQLEKLEKQNKGDQDEEEISKVASLITKFQRQIAAMQKKENISWTLLSTEGKHSLTSAVSKQRQDLLTKLNVQNIERMFLSSLIKKYPSGQAISNRIFRNIKRVVTAMKKIIKKYNETTDITPGLKNLSLKDVVKEDASALPLARVVHNNIAPVYFLTKRSEEEIQIIKKDMASCINYFQKQVNALHASRLINFDIEHYLTSQQFKMELVLRKLHEQFRPVISGAVNTPIYDQLEFESAALDTQLEEEDFTEDEPCNIEQMLGLMLESDEENESDDE